MTSASVTVYKLRNVVRESASRSVWPEILALLLLPAVLISLNASWTYLPPDGAIDPYIYTGFFRDLKGYLLQADFYQGSRLPWLLLGNAAYYVASPEVANLFLRLVVFYAAVLATFAVVYGLWRQRTAAFMVTLVLAVQPYFLNVVRSDYVSGPGAATILLTLACLTLARNSRWSYLLLAGAGCAAALNFSINIFLVVVAPVYFAWFAAMHLRLADIRGTALRAAAVAAGALATFAFFGLINLHLKGTLNYMAPQIDSSKSLDASVYRTPGYGWVEYSGWLVIPAALFLLSCGLCAFAAFRLVRAKRLSKPEAWLGFAGAQAIAVGLILVVFQLYEGPILQYQWYAIYFVPFGIIALGGALSYGLKATARLDVLLVALGAMVLLSLLPLFWGSMRLGTDCISYCSVYGTNMVLLTAGVTLAFLALVLVRHPALAVGGVLFLSLLSANAADQVFYNTARSGMMYDRFLLVYDIDDAIWKYNRHGELYFWYNKSDPMGTTYQAAASLRLWYGRLISHDFPTLKNPVLDKNNPVPIGVPIALFSDKPDAVEEAKATFETQSLDLRVLDRFVVSHEGERVQVTMILAEPRGRSIPLVAADFRPLVLSKQIGPERWNGLYGPVGSFPTESLGNNYWVDTIVVPASDPQGCAGSQQTLWPDSPPPTSPQPTQGAFELGVRFTADEASLACGVRFFKAAGSAGPHKGTLWSDAGAGLATAAFANETPSGWQTALFPTPVAIDPAKQYVTSYSSPSGNIAYTGAFFVKSGIRSGILRAPLGSNKVRTKAEAWAYAAEYPIPDSLRSEAGGQSLYLHIRALSPTGNVGFMVMDQTQTVVLAQASVPKSDRSIDIFLPVPDLTKVSTIIVRTLNRSDAGALEVESIAAILVDKPIGS